MLGSPKPLFFFFHVAFAVRINHPVTLNGALEIHSFFLPEGLSLRFASTFHLLTNNSNSVITPRFVIDNQLLARNFSRNVRCPVPIQYNISELGTHGNMVRTHGFHAKFHE